VAGAAVQLHKTGNLLWRQHFRWVSIGRVGQNANSLRLVGRFGMISMKTAKRPMGCTGHFFGFVAQML